MNKTLVVVLGLLLVVSVAGNTFLYNEVQNKGAEISRLQADLATWKNEYSKLDEHAKSLEEQLNEANSKLAEYEKQVGELQGQIVKYEEDLEGLKDQINELSTQLDDKNAKISILQGQLNTAQTDLSNLENLYENMKFGAFYFSIARLDGERGNYYYDLAGIFYNANYFLNASEYYQYAESYYKWAKQEYLEAEGYLKTALQYAEGDDRELVSNYLKMVEYGIELMDAMYLASSYMANACDSYASGDYESGDYWVDKVNEKIEDYNSYLGGYNLYAGKISKYFGID